jgi:hypothetical protein
MKQLAIFQQNKAHYKNYGLMLVICLLAYWPLTFGVFSVKNDAIHYFLPYRFTISEAIRNGEMPFWSPYIYLGNPIYGDMQSGAWNPVVWFFSLIGRYDISLFHFENLLYIFFAGLGMYKLSYRLTQHAQAALLIAVSYMLSGFMLGGQLINWLAAAAFFPFVIHYYLQTLQSSKVSYSIKTGFALYLLLTAGYPSFFITTCYLLLLIFIITIIKRLKEKQNNFITWKKFILNHLVAAAVFTGLALPAIVSYIDLLPYYNRGGGTSYTDTLSNSFEWQHLITFFFPSAIKANDLVSTTDITCRNVYIGIFPLLILGVFPSKLNRRNILLILLAVFALLFSVGVATPVRKLCYELLPGMNTFRHPSQMRLFFVFAVLLLAAPGVKSFFEDNDAGKKTKTAALLFSAAIGIVTLIALFDSNILTQIKTFSFSQIQTAVKNTLENISLADVLFINGLVQLAFLGVFLYWKKKHEQHKKLFSFLWIANLFLFVQFALPVSFVSSISAKEINKLIHVSPKGFPVSGLENSLANNSKDIVNHYEKISLSTFYNKKIGISRVAYSPSFLQEQDDFLSSNLLYNYVASRPVAYIADSVIQLKDTIMLGINPACNYALGSLTSFMTNRCTHSGKAVIKKLSANSFEIETDSPNSSALLVLTQSYHHHWKVWVDGNISQTDKTNIGFMSTVAPMGHHTILFKFIPSNTVRALWLMLATVAVLMVGGLVSLIRRNNHRPA